MDEPVVSVRGEVQQEVPPELAHFTVTVTARDADRQVTLRRVTERAATLRAVLAEYGDVIERQETSGLHVYPEPKRDGRGERVAAYHGRVGTTVTVADFAVLGDLMLRLADQDQTQLHGPWWSLRPDSPAYREARRAAITDAIARARDYAEAVGARLVRLIEISDVGTGDRPLGMRLAAATLESEGPSIVLDPPAQTVSAQVAIRFTITEPTV
jgi:uncharacterized protein